MALTRPGTLLSCISPLLQVKPDSKFVDLGADSLDTVSSELEGEACWTFAGSSSAQQ
jgi:hypothetical protein